MANVARFAPVPFDAVLGMVTAGLNSSDYASVAIDAVGVAIQPGRAQVGLEQVDGYVLQVTAFIPKTELDVIPQAKRLHVASGGIDGEYVKGVFPFGLVAHAIVPRARLPKIVQDQLAEIDKQNDVDAV